MWKVPKRPCRACFAFFSAPFDCGKTVEKNGGSETAVGCVTSFSGKNPGLWAPGGKKSLFLGFSTARGGKFFCGKAGFSAAFLQGHRFYTANARRGQGLYHGFPAFFNRFCPCVENAVGKRGNQRPTMSFFIFSISPANSGSETMRFLTMSIEAITVEWSRSNSLPILGRASSVISRIR